MDLVDVDVTFDIMGSYMIRITCMLREIELMTLVGVIYIGYIGDMNFTCMLFFYQGLVEIDKLTEVTSIEYLITLQKNRCLKK